MNATEPTPAFRLRQGSGGHVGHPSKEGMCVGKDEQQKIPSLEGSAERGVGSEIRTETI